MRNKILAAVATAAIATLVNAAPAAATAYPVNATDNFTATPGPNGTFAGAFRVTGLAAGMFTDTFTFTLPANGMGSGTVTTSASVFGSANDLDFTSVMINKTVVPITFLDMNRLGEVAFQNNISIIAGQLNTLTVSGISRGGGAYGGQLSFIPSAVPETATWIMMLMGFGMVGAGVRYRRRNTAVSFA